MNDSAPTEIWCTLTGQIDGQLVPRVFQFFSNAVNGGVKTVHLLVHSTGGFVSDGIALYNYLSNLPVNLVAYNPGGVSSIAVIVFLSAKKRIASDTSTFMIHKTHASPAAGATAAMLKEVADSLNIDNARTESILHKHLSLPEEKWQMHEHGNLTITSQEAIQFALIHEIGSFCPPPNGPLYNV